MVRYGPARRPTEAPGEPRQKGWRGRKRVNRVAHPVNGQSLAQWHRAGNALSPEAFPLAHGVLRRGAMSTHWQHLYRPAAIGFVIGLVVTTAFVYLAPAGVGPPATLQVR